MLAGVAAVGALGVAGAGRIIGSVVASTGTDPIVAYGGITVAVLGFAGILVRQLVKQSTLWKEIVNSLRDQLAVKDDEIAYVTWEREHARFRAHERTDPGPAPTPRRVTA